MAEARDRLVRPVDLAAAFARRRGPLGILVDDEMDMFGSPGTQLRTPGMTMSRGTTRARGGFGNGSTGTPRMAVARGRVLFGSPMTGRGMRSPGRSVLPVWYPRTPLRDITDISRAIERQRSRLGGDHGSPLQLLQARNVRTPQRFGAPAKDDTVTPSPANRKKKCHSDARNFLLQSANAEFLTPEKKLLDQIETVKEVVMDELQKLKRTPSAKKAEREKKLRVLRSMR